MPESPENVTELAATALKLGVALPLDVKTYPLVEEEITVNWPALSVSVTCGVLADVGVAPVIPAM